VHKKFGYMKCPDCGERVVVKINERETLSYTCDECDGSAYSKKGEGRYPKWLEKIERAPGVPAPGPKPAPAPATPAKKRGMLDDVI